MTLQNTSSNYFKTNDGAGFHCLEAGRGDTVLMLPGGGFSAQIFKYQIEELCSSYRVISVDKRGHGKSEKVDYGYSVSRFGKDLYDLFTGLETQSASIIAHSLGASMVYEYIDLFGTEKIEKLVIVDEPPCLLINPAWSEKERRNYGAIYEASTLHELTNAFTGEGSEELKRKIVGMMTTKYATIEQKEFILSCMDITGEAAAKIYFNNICRDFRDVIKKIDVPTLLITGEASLLPWQSHEWMRKQIPDSRLALFTEEEGGNHFTFVENPEKFNGLVLSFLEEK